MLPKLGQLYHILRGFSKISLPNLNKSARINVLMKYGAKRLTVKPDNSLTPLDEAKKKIFMDDD